MSNLPKIIAVLGPTASGKSELAVNLARKFGGEIISADSRQIYKGMDIGTAKISKDKNPKSEILISKQIQNSKFSAKGGSASGGKIQNFYQHKGVPHYLINIVAPDKTLTLAEYQKKAIQAARKIAKKGKIPILCGGTGLYIKAVVDNLKIPEVPPNSRLREKIEKEITRKGLAAVYQKLLKLDPGAEEFIDPKNPRRIIRALEVCLITKKPFSELRQKGEPIFKVLQIGLKIPTEKLRERINKRVNAQIKAGLLEEVRRLAKKYPWNLPSMSGLGYKEFKNYLAGKETLESAVETLKKNTRQYAKRQMTWFSAEGGSARRLAGGKKDPAPEQVRYGAGKRIKWIKNEKEAERLVKNFLKN